jgi:hypothetical protein
MDRCNSLHPYVVWMKEHYYKPFSQELFDLFDDVIKEERLVVWSQCIDTNMNRDYVFRYIGQRVLALFRIGCKSSTNFDRINSCPNPASTPTRATPP